jgi:hypothetical protein
MISRRVEKLNDIDGTNVAIEMKIDYGCSISILILAAMQCIARLQGCTGRVHCEAQRELAPLGRQLTDLGSHWTTRIAGFLRFVPL